MKIISPDQLYSTSRKRLTLGMLEHYGIRGPSQSLIQSFLNRQQFVLMALIRQ